MRFPGHWALLAGLFGCAIPYNAEPVRHEMPLPADAFEKILPLVRLQYRRLTVVDPVEFRIQTDWVPFQRGDTPGEKRATVFRDQSGRLQVLVEVRSFSLGQDSLVVSPIYGDRRSEEELAGSIEQILTAPIRN